MNYTSRVMLQIVVSLTIVSHNHVMFIVKATYMRSDTEEMLTKMHGTRKSMLLFFSLNGPTKLECLSLAGLSVSTLM